MTKVASVWLLMWCACACSENSITVFVEVPELDAHPYHRPYVAVWLETAERQPIGTIGLWVEQEDWLKDLRQWWRKMGRRSWKRSEQLDSVTGATRKPGVYELTWPGVPDDGGVILHLEAVREKGGRSHIKQKIDLLQDQSFEFEPEGEFGSIKIHVQQLPRIR